MSNELIITGTGESTEERYTQKEMAEKLGISQPEVSKRIKDAGMKPDGVRRITKSDGKETNVAVYSLAKLVLFQKEEEERNKTILVANKTKSAIDTMFDKKLGGFVVQSVMQNLDNEQMAIMAASLIQMLQTRLTQSQEENAKITNELKLIKDNHETFLSWVRIQQEYGDQFLVNGYDIRDFKTWRCKALKIGGKFMGDVCQKKQVEVANSKYKQQYVFHIKDVFAYFKW